MPAADVRDALATASTCLRGIDRAALGEHDPDFHRLAEAVAALFNAVKDIADALEGN